MPDTSIGITRLPSSLVTGKISGEGVEVEHGREACIGILVFPHPTFYVPFRPDVSLDASTVLSAARSTRLNTPSVNPDGPIGQMRAQGALHESPFGLPLNYEMQPCAH